MSITKPEKIDLDTSSTLGLGRPRRQRSTSRSRVQVQSEIFGVSSPLPPAPPVTSPKEHDGSDNSTIEVTPRWLTKFYSQRRMLIIWGILHLIDVVNDYSLVYQLLKDGSIGLATCSILILVFTRLVTTRLVMGTFRACFTSLSGLRQTLLLASDLYPVLEVKRLLQSPKTPTEARIALDPCFMSPTIIFIEVVLESIPQLFVHMTIVITKLLAWNGTPSTSTIPATIDAAVMAENTVAVSVTSVVLSLLFSAYLLASTLNASEASDTKDRQVFIPDLHPSFWTQSLKTCFRVLEIFGRALTVTMLLVLIRFLTTPVESLNGGVLVTYSRLTQLVHELLVYSQYDPQGCASERVLPNLLCRISTSSLFAELGFLLLLVSLNVAIISYLSRRALVSFSPSSDDASTKLTIKSWLTFVLTFIFWERRIIAQLPVHPATLSAATTTKASDTASTRKTVVVSPLPARIYYWFRAFETLFLIFVTFILTLLLHSPNVTYSRSDGSVTEADPTAFLLAPKRITITWLVSAFASAQMNGIQTLGKFLGALPQFLDCSMKSIANDILSREQGMPSSSTDCEWVIPTHGMLNCLIFVNSLLCVVVTCFALVGANSFGWKPMAIGSASFTSPLVREETTHTIATTEECGAGVEPRISNVAGSPGSTRRSRITAALERAGVPLSSTPRRAYVRVVDELQRNRPDPQPLLSSPGLRHESAESESSSQLSYLSTFETPFDPQTISDGVNLEHTLKDPRSRRRSSLLTGSRITFDLDIAGSNNVSHFKNRF